MKKILLSLLAVSTLSFAYSQVFTASDSLGFSQFTQVDSDGDSIGYEFVSFEGSTDSIFDALGECLMGESWRAGTILFPDNYLISPAIDLTGITDVQLSWTVFVSDPDYPAEKYSVYVVTDVSQVMGATALFTETLTSAATTPSMRSVDLSQFDGESTVYFAFRHHDVSDQYRFFLDDFTVASTAGFEEKEISVRVYPNPTSDVLTFDLAEEIEFVEVYSLTGQIVKSGDTKELNVSDLNEGTYLYRVQTNSGKVSNGTFVKK